MPRLDEKALLVKLSISQWTARKEDKKITKEVETQHNARDAGRYHKTLIAKEEIQKLQKISNEARTYHYTNTLPWKDDGERILPTTIYFDYTREIGKLKARFQNAVASFLQNYPALIDDAKTRLNGMFNAEDYPNAAKIGKKFSFETEFSPIPTAADFRINLQTDEINKISKDLETRLKATEQEAIKDLWTRLYSTVKNAADRLSDPEAIFRDSLMGNISELVNLLPKLNFTDDPALETMRRDVEKELVRFTPETLREDKEARKQTAEKARELLKGIAPHVRETAETTTTTAAATPVPPAPRRADADRVLDAMQSLF
jgi:hypothetical protein